MFIRFAELARPGPPRVRRVLQSRAIYWVHSENRQINLSVSNGGRDS